ncbi:MAG: hypothetical protein QM645_09585 [Asticcacaulis sp.]
MRLVSIALAITMLGATPALAIEALSPSVLHSEVPAAIGSSDEARICSAVMAAIAQEMSPHRQSDHVEKSYQGFKLASIIWIQEIARIEAIDASTYMADFLRADVDAILALSKSSQGVHMQRCITRTETLMHQGENAG